MRAQSKQRDITEKEAEQALSYLDSSDRDLWWKMAFAIKSEFGENGFSIWDNWGRTFVDYDERHAMQVWKSAKAGGGVNIGTLIYEAKLMGFELDASEEAQPDLAAQEARAKMRAEAKAQSIRETREAHAAAMIQANAIWDAATPASVHPYLTKKGVQASGLRVGSWPLRRKTGEVYGQQEGTLLVPMRNIKGQITSLQAIFDKMPSGFTQGKSYLKDGNKSGSWHMIGQIGDGDTIALCEGYATGATIRELSGWCVLVCFDRTNLLTVGEQVRELTPGIAMVVCADNDQFTEGNPGVHDAKKAANTIGAKVLIPQFKNPTKEHSDFNDLATVEGVEEAKLQLGIKKPAPKDVAPANDNNPFYPLGYDRGNYFYLVSGTQQLCKLSAAQHSKAHMMQLAPLSYWMTEYPAKQGVAWDIAADELIQQCQAMGVFTPDVIRGRGAWMDEGRVVFHFGSNLWVDGDLMSITAIRSKFVYEKDLELSQPNDRPLTDKEGQELVDIARQFRWTKPASAALLAGFVALAPLCGALRWRPHVWLTGGAGCGKTTVLNEYVHTLMGGMDVFAQGNSTEAGIRQELRSDALPVLFDESEQNNEREAGRVQNVLSLIRQASSQSEAKTLKGSVSGESMHFMVRSMFCLSSIQVGIKHQADYERLTVLALRPKRDDNDAANSWDKLKERLHWLKRDEELPTRLFRRALDLLPTTLKNIKTFVDAASRHFGSVREGDQYGTLLAGCWSLTNTGLATPSQAAELIASFEWEEFRENLEMDDSTKALGALLEAQLRTPAGVSLTVFEVVTTASGAGDASQMLTAGEAEKLLQRYGMRTELDTQQLLLSNTSQALTDLLKHTAYAADWRGQLLRVAGVHRFEKSKRFNGTVSKCIAVPLSAIMERTEREGAPF